MNKPLPESSIPKKHERDSKTGDAELVARAQKGDADAFRVLFERYHRRAYSLALGVVRNPDDALDVVQDGFIKAHRYLDRFKGTSSFTPGSIELS